MKEMPDESIDMAITSPPYWGLRDYGFEQIFGGDKDCKHRWTSSKAEHDNLRYRGHSANVGSNKNPDIHPGKKGSGGKHCTCGAWRGQLGLEPTPELYIEHLTEIFNEIKRILKKEGTLWLNMGDTYNAGRAGGCPGGKKGIWHPENAPNQSGVNVTGLKPKCLCMIPERLSWSLIQSDWILRNKIPWIKPNCMPSSVKDRYTNKWEYVFYFVKSQRNYFDLDSIREPHSFNRWAMSSKIGSEAAKQAAPGQTQHSWQRKGHSGYYDGEGNLIVHPLGKNPGDIWTIPTVACPFPGVHFATFPEKLCKKAIIPGSPEDGIILDPFCGVGTALYVAKELRRRFIGIDIKQEYCQRSEKRLAQGVL
ncbi:site-specific DNA-methyltransferase [bacterium]|nr:site-specific DNA-methyltransferase [bacterium]